MNQNMTARNYLITVLLVAITSNYLAAPLAAAYDGSDIHYDPEQQDGIPVISSRSLAPAITGRYGDRLAELDSAAAAASPSSERRNSDADLDDGLEDEDEAEDRDEYKSGSSNHDTYESPAFGESRRAAKDGDDIESFFDKHLGPQDAIENRDDNEIPINETPLRASAVDSDSDSDSDGDGDGYEAAASGPIATILSSIINRRPIVITATTGGSDQSSDSKASASDEKQTQLSLGESSTAAAAAGDEGEVGGTPVAFYAPMAASSNAYEQEQSEQAPLGETIYVSRRPYATAAGGQQQQRYQPLLYPAHLMDQQASNAAASMRFRGRQPQYYQAHYPAPAHSHSYQRQRPQPQPAEDDEQTVSYNLSFGGGGASSALLADDETTTGASDEAPDEQVAAAEPADYERRPLAGYSSMRSYASPMMMVVNPAEQQRLYQQQQRAMLLQQQQNQQQQQAAQMQMQQQAARAGARYHKDPSESIASQYVQYSRQAPATPQQQRRQPQSAAPADTQQQQPAAAAPRDELRDQLLASLSEQIKANPNYWRPAADGGASETRDGSGGSPAPSSSTDVDTYSSYHSEVGPHSSRTTSSRLVSGLAAAPAARANSPLESTYLAGGNRLRKFPQQQQPSESGVQANSRVRRDDSEEREGADDDDGVWVDDDDDDDNRQQSSSDVNETAQDPGDDDEDSDGSQQDGQLEDSNQHRAAVSPPPVGQLAGGVARLHGYEISPDDLMVYPPSVM